MTTKNKMTCSKSYKLSAPILVLGIPMYRRGRVARVGTVEHAQAGDLGAQAYDYTAPRVLPGRACLRQCLIPGCLQRRG